MSELNEMANRVHDQVAGINRVSLFPASSLKKVDYSGGTTIYIGVAAPGTADGAAKSWFIERVTVSSGVVVDHATGDWTSRASLTYT